MLAFTQIVSGDIGVAVVRIEGGWSAPCALRVASPSGQVSLH